jgi:hypothetical protein
MVVKSLQEIVVPNQKSCIFVSPDYNQWQYLLDYNKQVLGEFSDTNMCRSQLLKTAVDYTRQIGISSSYQAEFENIIVTGHQAVWHHCGILAKNIVTNHFACQVGGCSVHLVLDHDIGNTIMILPEIGNDEKLYFRKTEIEHSQQDIPLEFRPAPETKQKEAFIHSISEKESRFCCTIWKEYSKLIFDEAACLRNVADFISQLQAILNSSLGINMLYLPVSLLSESECFTTFLISIISDAFNFAKVYNQAISNQIQTYNLNPAHTLKPLRIDFRNYVVELPFWLIFASGQRFSLYISFGDKNRIGFGTISDILGCLDSSTYEGKKEQLIELMNKHNCRLRPKAVSLTLFVRLYLADWFVHGTGGGFYEKITDYLIMRYFKTINLNFGIATATMTLPLQKTGYNFCCTKSQLKTQLRELKFNPERFINTSVSNRKSVKALIQKKSKLIEATKKPGSPTIERKEAWQMLSRVNKQLLRYAQKTRKELLTKVDLLEKNKISKEVVNYREFFFGLFPEGKLRSLANLEEVKNDKSLNCCSPS